MLSFVRARIGKQALVELGHDLLDVGKFLRIRGRDVIIQTQLPGQLFIGSHESADERAVHLLGIGHHDEESIWFDDGVPISHHGLDDQLSLLCLSVLMGEKGCEAFGRVVEHQLQQAVPALGILPRQPIKDVGRREDGIPAACIRRGDGETGGQTFVDVKLDAVGALNGVRTVQRCPQNVRVDLGRLQAGLLQQLRNVVVLTLPEGRLPFISHPGLQILHDHLPFVPGQIAVAVEVVPQHDITPEQGLAVSFNEVVKGHIPRVELEAGLTPESLARALQFGARERGDGLAHDAPGQSVSKMALTAALANAEAAIQKP